ncbi:unnamed protein product [Adineta ricciae]|uniref:Uncharacterized protein n=1 Tax=Adineta ricciae TaxID=249248 RepID=A0A815M1C7_ADIRI|nr:unnamed protein product [Adineta ricciae]
MKRELIEHIERNQAAHPALETLIQYTKCCEIDGNARSNEIFESFQRKYPKHCNETTPDQAKPCLVYIKHQRNIITFFNLTLITCRVLVLFLLWKYVKEEYSNTNNELMASPTTNAEQSVTNTVI